MLYNRCVSDELFQRSFRSCDRILQQNSNSHRADAAGDGGDEGGFFGNFIEGDVSEQFEAGFFLCAGNPVVSDVNDVNSFLDYVRFQKFGFSDRRNDDISSSRIFFNMFSF